MNASVAAIILAAGSSTRLGQPKQMLVLQGETLLARAIRLACESGAAAVLAVLGARFDAIAPSIAGAKADIVLNEQWEHGIATSIHAGISALQVSAPAAFGALILTCDQPRLTAKHLRDLIETFTAQPEPSIVASTYAGTVGIPAVFPRGTFPHLLALRGDRGARSLLVNPPCPLVARAFAGGEIDIDLPGDLAELA